MTLTRSQENRIQLVFPAWFIFPWLDQIQGTTQTRLHEGCANFSCTISILLTISSSQSPSSNLNLEVRLNFAGYFFLKQAWAIYRTSNHSLALLLKSVSTKICQSCYIDLSKWLHEFAKFLHVTRSYAALRAADLD